MGNMKKLLVSTVVLASVAMGAAVWTTTAAELPDVRSEADIAGELGILQGDGSGLTAEYLAKSTTRYQAAVMSLRLKGLEKEALAFQGQDNFDDASLVYQEGRSVLAYLKANPNLGWQGSGSNIFEPTAAITAQDYYKVMLEALGYKQDTDFTYEQTLDAAAKHGLTAIAAVPQLLNEHVATATLEALRAPVKDGGTTLAAELSKKGVIQAEQLKQLEVPSLKLWHSESLGSYLTDSKGMTLYYFTKDAADANSCTGDCLTKWPVFSDTSFIVPAGFEAKDFAAFIRQDGKEQVTYKGWPLYYFAQDGKPGDTIGDGVGKVWYVIKPSSGVALGTKADLGSYLTDASGMTLYYFDKDTKGVSNCSGECLQKWPPFYAEHVAPPTGVDSGDFGTIVRPDGSKQTTYKGWPLYYWIKDKNPGETTGQNVGQVWFVINPSKTEAR